jgi:hypothetical protein
VGHADPRALSFPEAGQAFVYRREANIKYDQANYVMARAIDYCLTDDSGVLDKANEEALSVDDPVYRQSKIRSIISPFVSYKGHDIAIKRVDKTTGNGESRLGGVIPIRHELLVALGSEQDTGSVAAVSSAYPSDGPKRSIVFPSELFNETDGDLRISLIIADVEIVSGVIAVAQSIDANILCKSVPRHLYRDQLPLAQAA